MIGFLAKATSIKMLSVCVLLSFSVGAGVGIWLCNKFYAASKIAMLNNYIERQAESHSNTLSILKGNHAKELKIARDEQPITTEVVKYVSINTECNLTVGAVGLLDNSRTGMSDASTRNDEGASRPSAITQRQQIESCARDGIQYRQLKVSYDGLREFILKNWTSGSK